MKTQPLKFPHPGEILREEFLDELNITQYRLANDTGIPHSRVTAIIHGKRAVSPDTALRLAQFFNNSPQFWLNLQTHYDLEQAEAAHGAAIREQISPLREAS